MMATGRSTGTPSRTSPPSPPGGRCVSLALPLADADAVCARDVPGRARQRRAPQLTHISYRLSLLSAAGVISLSKRPWREGPVMAAIRPRDLLSDALLERLGGTWREGRGDAGGARGAGLPENWLAGVSGWAAGMPPASRDVAATLHRDIAKLGD